MLKRLSLFLLFLCLLTATKAQSTGVHEVFDEIKRLNIKFPDIVCKQAILESGWMKTKFFQKTNNLFGFKTRKGYMKFDTWQSCVAYYADWQSRMYSDTTQTYYDFLKKKRYAANMKKYLKKLDKIKIPTPAIKIDSIQVDNKT